MTQLDSNVEEVTLQEIQLRKAFRSTQNFDQQVVYSYFLEHMSGSYIFMTGLHRIMFLLRSYLGKLCQSLCWNNTSHVTSLLPWISSILTGGHFFPNSQFFNVSHPLLPFKIVLQGGRQGRTEILHGCKLLFRSVAVRDVAVHGEG